MVERPESGVGDREHLRALAEAAREDPSYDADHWRRLTNALTPDVVLRLLDDLATAERERDDARAWFRSRDTDVSGDLTARILLVGVAITIVRQRQGLTQEAFGAGLGHTQEWCSHIERGKRMPSVIDLQRMSKRYGLQLVDGTWRVGR